MARRSTSAQTDVEEDQAPAPDVEEDQAPAGPVDVTGRHIFPSGWETNR